jgi:AraC family transcriptional regulator, melibiose operon regulatory protein
MITVSDEKFLVEQHLADAMGVAHWHNHVEVNLLLCGRMSYVFSGRQEHIEAGRLALFWAAIPHCTFDVEQGTMLVCIYVPLMDFLSLPVSREIRQSIMGGAFLTDRYPDPADIAAGDRWVEGWQSNDKTRRRLVMDEIFVRIRRLFIDNSDDKNSARLAPDTPNMAGLGPVQRAEILAELIHDHFSEPLSVKRLAAISGIHASTANKSFQQVMGLSVNEYIIRYRLTQAMRRLAETNAPILQIAFGCGFGSSSQFYDLFRHHVGETPRKFRLENRSTAR